MKDRSVASRRISRFAHPKWTIVASLIGCAGTALAMCAVYFMRWMLFSTCAESGWSADMYEIQRDAASRLIRAPWLSLWVGLAIGLPATFALKSIGRRHADFYVRCCVTSERKIARPREVGMNLLGILPIASAVFLSLAVTWVLRISLFPAPMGVLVWSFLAYPEQRAIYEKAQRILRDLPAMQDDGPDSL